MTTEHRHLGSLDRMIFLGVCGLSALLFWNLGWMAFGPQDPLGAISLQTQRFPLLALAQAAGLSAVVSGVATFIIGTRLSLIGPFTAGLGLIVASIRGGTATYLLLHRGSAGNQAARTSLAALLEDVVGWAAVMAVSVLASFIIQRWLLGSSGPKATTVGGDLSSGEGLTPNRVRPGDASSATATAPQTLTTGLIHLAICTVAAIVVVSILSSGYQSRAVEHGQACFLAAASMALATYLAQRIQPVDNPLWALSATAIAGVIGFALASRAVPNAALPTTIPTHPFFTMLPLQFICAGCCGVILMTWYLEGHRAEKTS